MSILLILLLLVVVLAVAGGLAAMLAWWALVGLVIGAIARLVVRDTAGYGILATILAGIVGAVGGGLIAHALSLGNLLEFVVSVLVAAVVIAVTAGSTGRRRTIV